MRERFRHFAHETACLMCSSWAFFVALVVVIVWAVSGPAFHFSDTWQLVINTGTTVVTFLMVFLIQSTQNRDSQAVHLKLDELLRAVGKARTSLVGLEFMTEKEMQALQAEFTLLHAKYAARAEQRARKTIDKGASGANSKSAD